MNERIETGKRTARLASTIAGYTMTVIIGSAFVISSSASALSFQWLDPRTYLSDNQGKQDDQGNANAQKSADKGKLKSIINRGDQEINRRLASLNNLTKTIAAATKLSASDRVALINEVDAAISGLTNLKAKLDADTTVSAARADARSIISEYRIYALVVPKVHLVKTADDIQVANNRLTTLAAQLQTQITAKQQAGKDVTEIQAKLDDMTSKTSMSQSIAVNIETNVIAIQPTDYNNNHSILSGDAAQLKTARSNSTIALADARAIVAALKKL